MSFFNQALLTDQAKVELNRTCSAPRKSVLSCYLHKLTTLDANSQHYTRVKSYWQKTCWDICMMGFSTAHFTPAILAAPLTLLSIGLPSSISWLISSKSWSRSLKLPSFILEDLGPRLDRLRKLGRRLGISAESLSGFSVEHKHEQK